MIANPIALLGLLAVAVPVLIHLLGRHQSRIERFPTLRFIGASRLTPTRRKRISDWLLLLVRVAIVAVAALALSQPVFKRTSPSASQLSRAIIVDTSASMPRVAPLSDSLTSNAVATQILTDSPSDAIPGAIAWLETQPGLREIAIVSDFQRSSIDSSAISAIPKDVGVSVIPKDVRLSVIPGAARDDIGVLAGPSDLAGATAAWRAVGRPVPRDTLGRIAIIYRSHPGADSLRRSAAPVDSMWMARIVAAVDRDPAFAALDSDSITAGRNGNRLSFFVRTDAGSLASAALNQALLRATATAIPASEMDSTHWSAATIASWKRAPALSPSGPHALAAPPSPRWFWLVALLLIALETWMRSRRRAGFETESATVVEPPGELAA